MFVVEEKKRCKALEIKKATGTGGSSAGQKRMGGLGKRARGKARE